MHNIDKIGIYGLIIIGKQNYSIIKGEPHTKRKRHGFYLKTCKMQMHKKKLFTKRYGSCPVT